MRVCVFKGCVCVFKGWRLVLLMAGLLALKGLSFLDKLSPLA